MEFEKLYIQLRSKENRIYSNKEVRNLPEIEKSHPYFNEWKLRKKSCKRLIRYLRSRNKPLNILEVGCGNGWLCANISKIKGANVTGIDINRLELKQGSEVFKDLTNLKFIFGTLETISMETRYDIIVFAASIQYFKLPERTIQSALDLSDADGEIHILDSHFYPDNKIAEAKENTKNYFKELGFENAQDYYHHHSFDSIKKFNYTILYKPKLFLKKLLFDNNPFYWICIKK